MKNYEANQRVGSARSGGGSATGGVAPDGEEVGMIPAQTQLQTALAINMGAEGKQVVATHL